ncbi:MAG: hypothetical protein KKB50_16825 [Planctomycetes bacterium]|nr:hypothetical protein [Planctomycetota bacterium]
MTSRSCAVCAATVVALGIAAFPALARADNPVTWPFDLQTSGQDVHHVSPTAVDNSADWYTLSYEITLVEVTVRYLWIELDVDVTDQIPPEQRSGSDTIDGPPPIVLADDDFVYPEPPDPASVAAHVLIGLDAAGHGYVSVTDVYLGEMEVYIEPFGYVTVQIEAVRVAGTVTAEPFWYEQGDLNCDRQVDGFDIDHFVQALMDWDGYIADHDGDPYPACDPWLADINQDGLVNGFDIDPFVALLEG